MSLLAKRQVPDSPRYTNDGNDWYYSSTAYYIKWAVVAAIFLIFIGFIIGGYIHAKRRMKKGLAPLAYHRVRFFATLFTFSLTNKTSGCFPAANVKPSTTHTPSCLKHTDTTLISKTSVSIGLGMVIREGMRIRWDHTGPPPPAYGHEDYVPAYTPPQGPNKVNPDQSYHAPQGPPPQQFGTVASGSGPHPGGDLGHRQ